MLDFILFFVDFSDMPPPVISSDEVYAAFGGVLRSNAEWTHDFAEGKLFANRLRAKVFTWMIACSLTTDKHRLKEEFTFFSDALFNSFLFEILPWPHLSFCSSGSILLSALDGLFCSGVGTFTGDALISIFGVSVGIGRHVVSTWILICSSCSCDWHSSL